MARSVFEGNKFSLVAFPCAECSAEGPCYQIAADCMSIEDGKVSVGWVVVHRKDAGLLASALALDLMAPARRKAVEPLVNLSNGASVLNLPLSGPLPEAPKQKRVR